MYVYIYNNNEVIMLTKIPLKSFNPSQMVNIYPGCDAVGIKSLKI